jgi:hypothetical protein
LLLGLASLAGLGCALVADGVADAVSWAALGLVSGSGLWLLRPARIAGHRRANRAGNHYR